MLIYLFQSFLFWNGLLNTEEYITKRFDEKNKIGFLYILSNEFNKYFFTSLIIWLSLKILKSLDLYIMQLLTNKHIIYSLSDV